MFILLIEVAVWMMDLERRARDGRNCVDIVVGSVAGCWNLDRSTAPITAMASSDFKFID